MKNIKLHILGSCSGTEPFPGRHHTSVALELSNGLYFFDAGECSSYTAHLIGLDLLKTRGIFISHCHMDHVGGLGNLLWTIRKLSVIERRVPLADTIHTFIPYLESYEGILQSLQYTEDDFRCDYSHEGHKIQDGLLYSSSCNDLSVEAIHNHHLGHKEGQPYRSFSFQIRTQGRTIFYSGDTALRDLAYTVPESCDLLMMETGHHQVPEVCRYLRTLNQKIDRLVFLHHGVKVLADPAGAAFEAEQLWGKNSVIAEDGMTITL